MAHGVFLENFATGPNPTQSVDGPDPRTYLVWVYLRSNVSGELR